MVWRVGFCARVGLIALFALHVPVLGAGGPLRVDPDAIVKGFVTFSGTDATTSETFSMEMDYAVFAPGAYPASYNGTDPSDGTRYVYAYQVFVDPASDGNLSSLSFKLESGAGVVDDDPSIAHIVFQDAVHPVLNGTNLSISALNPFMDPDPKELLINFPDVPPGDHSVVFIATSVNPPTMIVATATGGPAIQAAQMVPSPAVPSATPAVGRDGAMMLTFLLILAAAVVSRRNRQILR